jgi:flagellar basal body P-ring formation protein FlgA
MRALRRLAVSAALTWVALTAPAAVQDRADADRQAEVVRFLESQARGIPGRVRITVEPIDQKGQLASCEKIEPYLPAGNRIPGKITVGIRCVDGANWNVFRSAKVSAVVPALVAVRAIAAGETIGAADTRVEDVDLGLYPAGMLADASELQDKVLTRAVKPGEALSPSWLRGKQAIAQGDLVRVNYRGAGFVVATEGRALSQATLGQRVRVQTEGGKVISGIAGPDKIVEVSL